MPDCSSKIVLQALSDEGLEVVASSTQKLIETREWFRHELEKISVIEKVYPSSTNFVLLKCLPDAELFEWLKQNGIVTRNQTHEPLLKCCIRITIGTPASMEEVINTLKAYPVNA
jgi:histidinol-phosphate aminotransferase